MWKERGELAELNARKQEAVGGAPAALALPGYAVAGCALGYRLDRGSTLAGPLAGSGDIAAAMRAVAVGTAGARTARAIASSLAVC
jgi:hypothetical protein